MWNTIFDGVKANLLDDAYDKQVGTGKAGPGPYRGSEYHYIQAVRESPKYLTSSPSDKDGSLGTKNVVIKVASHYKKEMPFNDNVGGEKYKNKDGELELIPYAINIGRVELLIDDAVIDITSNLTTLPADGAGITYSEYTYTWKT